MAKNDLKKDNSPDVEKDREHPEKEKTIQTKEQETLREETENTKKGESKEYEPEDGMKEKEQRTSELLARIESLEKEKEELYNRYLRLMADFDNYRKRTREELVMARERGVEELVLKLLPVLDNLERAINSGGEPEKWRDGINMVIRQFHDLLAGEGVVPVKAVGEKFDPQKHEAIAREKSDQPENTVIEELQKGYLFKEKTIRPSLVKVATKEE